MPDRVETVEVAARDGATVQARVFAPPAGHAAARAALFFMPAMGAPARIYDAFAAALAAAGVGVLVGDHRGGASSSVRPGRGTDFDYADMLERDWPALEAAARRAFPGTPLHLGGHSLGAHLAALYAGAGGVPGGALVIAAAGSVHWRAYPPAQRVQVLAGSRLVAATARLLGHYPGHRLGFGGHQVRGVMLDWARESRHGRYSSRGGALDLEADLARVDRRTLAVHVRGDSLAPESTTAALLARMPRARVVSRHVAPPAEPQRLNAHFRWTRAPDPVAAAVAEFLADE